MTELDIEPTEAEKSPNSKLKIVVDVLSVLFVVNMLILNPIWAHYDDYGLGPGGKYTFHMKYMLASFPIFMFGFLWLVLRHGATLNRKFPTLFKPEVFGPLAVLGLPLLFLIFRKVQ